MCLADVICTTVGVLQSSFRAGKLHSGFQGLQQVEELTVWQEPLPAGKHLAEQLVWDHFHKKQFPSFTDKSLWLRFCHWSLLTSPLNALVVPGSEEIDQVKGPCQLFQVPQTEC